MLVFINILYMPSAPHASSSAILSYSGTSLQRVLRLQQISSLRPIAIQRLVEKSEKKWQPVALRMQPCPACPRRWPDPEEVID